MTKDKNTCLVCRSSELLPLIDFGNCHSSSQSYYVQPKFLEKENRLSISICLKCEHIQNTHYELLNEIYESNYFSSSSFSKTLINHLSMTYSKVSKFIFPGKDDIIEIGPGDGQFLQFFTKDNFNCSCYEPSDAYEYIQDSKFLKKHKRYFEFEKDKSKCSLFIMRHVLEHLENPLHALKSIEAKYLFIEVPNADYLIKKNLYSDFYYDHVSYFTRNSLRKLLALSGYKLIEDDVSGLDEFIGVIAKKINNSNLIINTPLNIDKYQLESFSKGFYSYRMLINGHIDSFINEGKRIVAWGAGARGITLLERIDLDDKKISYIVDADRRKVGKYLVNFSQEIKDPNYLLKLPPDVIIITSLTFIDEILNHIKSLLNEVEIVTLYPYKKFRLYSP